MGMSDPKPDILANLMVISPLNSDSAESIAQIKATVEKFKEERLQRARAGYYGGIIRGDAVDMRTEGQDGNVGDLLIIFPSIKDIWPSLSLDRE